MICHGSDCGNNEFYDNDSNDCDGDDDRDDYLIICLRKPVLFSL